MPPPHLLLSTPALVGVKKKVPVFWVEGLGLQSEDSDKVTTPVFFDEDDAIKFWKQVRCFVTCFVMCS